MKAFNNFFGLFLITILIGMTGCAKQDLEIGERSLPTKKVANVKLDVAPIIIDNAAFNATGDLFTAINFTIEDEIIMMTTNYFAGCNPVQFRLVADTQVQYSGTGIPIFNSKLILDNNDKCTYFMKKTVAFDLSPLEQVGHNEILLKIADFGEVLYSY